MKGVLRTGAGRARRACVRLARRVAGTNRLILLYHRVADVRPDPWGLCVSPARFAEHLEVLSQSGFKCLRLRDLVRLLRDGTLPRRAVAITFDDGYADNLYAAKPLLEQTGTRATVFVVTGATGRAQEFWWDELAGMLLQPDGLPAHLSIALDDQIHAWELGTAVDDAEDSRRGHEKCHAPSDDG
jgi:peptidoglycan/xylan/chitin deacetylase (PgdA/CDA1 family)